MVPTRKPQARKKANKTVASKRDGADQKTASKQANKQARKQDSKARIEPTNKHAKKDKPIKETTRQ